MKAARLKRFQLVLNIVYMLALTDTHLLLSGHFTIEKLDVYS